LTIFQLTAGVDYNDSWICTIKGVKEEEQMKLEPMITMDDDSSPFLIKRW